MSFDDLLDDKNAWLKIKKYKHPEDGRTVYHFKASCCRVEHHWEYGQKPKVCPSCGDVFWDKPKHEYVLFTLQEKVKERCQESSVKFFEVLLGYVRTLLNNILLRAKVSLPLEEFSEKAENLAFLLFERVLAGKYVNVSFGALLLKMIPGELYNDHEKQSFISLNEKRSGDEAEFWERKNIPQLRSEEKHEESKAFDRQIAEDITKIMGLVVEKVRFHQGVPDSLIFLSGLISSMKKKSTTFLQKFYTEFGTEARNNIEKGGLLVFKYVKDLQEQGPIETAV